MEEGSDTPPRKRPRINRACAACRRRKIKCNGSQPCKACLLNDLICSYEDEERRRNGPEYIQALEKKVEELEGLLGHPLESNTRSSSSRQASNRLGSHESSQQPISFRRNESELSSKASSIRPSPISQDVTAQESSETLPNKGSSEDDVLETMISTSDQRPQGKQSEERYWGHFSGLSLLQRMRKLCGSVAGLHQSQDGESCEDDFADAFDTALPPQGSPGGWDAFALLPSENRLLQCVDVALKDGCCLLKFVDRSSIDEIVRQIYDTDSFEYTPQDRKSLALIFSILAVGRRFENDKNESDAQKRRNNISKGLRYFRAARSMLDVADCHDIVSLQTVLFLVIYLQANSMLSTCYSYICAGVAAALRMGLHSPHALEELPPEQQQVRRCIFAVLNIMDTYVTTALGLPRTLRDVDAGSVVPIPNAPDHPTPDTSILPENADAMLVATNAHAKLIQITARAVDSNHPVTKHLCQRNGFYGVQYHKIAAVEQELEAWHSALPQSLYLDSEEDPHILRAQLLLRLGYAHSQMVLYRPFLHHAAKSLRPYREVRYKAYACGSACVKAAMQVGWLAEALESRGLFNEANWFVSYTVSFAATILTLFVLSNDGDDTIQPEAETAQRLKDLLGRHADQNPAARRSSTFLQELEIAKKEGKKHPYSELSGHTDDPFRTPTNPRNHNDPESLDQDITTTAEKGTDNGHELQAMSYPLISDHLNVNGLEKV